MQVASSYEIDALLVILAILKMPADHPCVGQTSHSFPGDLEQHYYVALFNCFVGVEYSVWYPTLRENPKFTVRENLCRAFSFGRTAKSFFAVRFI
jgi:hypothetical protein